MIILPERLRAATGPTDPDTGNIWTPFHFMTANASYSVFASTSYWKSIVDKTMGPISDFLAIEKTGDFMTEQDYVNYLMTRSTPIGVKFSGSSSFITRVATGRNYTMVDGVTNAPYGNSKPYMGRVEFQADRVEITGGYSLSLSVYIYYTLTTSGVMNTNLPLPQ